MSRPPTKSAANKLAGLELLRFLAAFTVLIAHYHHFFFCGYAAGAYTLEGQPLYRSLGFLYRYGTRAVEVFWSLSGFVFFYRYSDPIRKKTVPALHFFWLRFSRLYPLHLATLVLVAVLQWIYWEKCGTFWIVELNNVKHFVLNLFFASNWGLQDGESFNAPIWSVSLEVLAYAVFFALTRFLGANAIVTLGVMIACVLFQHLAGFEPVLLRCLFYFYLGGLSCLAYRQVNGRLKAGRRYLGLIPAGGLLLWAIIEFRTGGNLDWLLNLGFPAAMAFLALVSDLLGTRVASGLDFLGNLTYASYLIHFPFQLAVMLVVECFHLDHGFVFSPGFLVFYLAAVFGLARLIYIFFELPAQAWIRRRTLGA